MIRRTFDPAFLNEVANHSEVRPFLGGEGALDATETLLNADNFGLVTEGGGFILMRLGPGIYEVHSQFLPEARRGSIRAMREGFEYMFIRTDCERIVTQVPDNNPSAAALAKLAHFRPMFRRENAGRGPTAFVGLGIDEWAQENTALEADGKAFHDQLEAAKQARGSKLPVHADDPAHDRAAGAAMRMVKAGNVAKGVEFYNRWARFAGYAEIHLVSETPVVIDVIDAVVGLTGGEMEILLCRSE